MHNLKPFYQTRITQFSSPEFISDVRVQLASGHPYKWFRISWLWHYIIYQSIPLYTNSLSQPFSRHTLYLFRSCCSWLSRPSLLLQQHSGWWCSGFFCSSRRKVNIYSYGSRGQTLNLLSPLFQFNLFFYHLYPLFQVI